MVKPVKGVGGKCCSPPDGVNHAREQDKESIRRVSSGKRLICLAVKRSAPQSVNLHTYFSATQIRRGRENTAVVNKTDSAPVEANENDFITE